MSNSITSSRFEPARGVTSSERGSGNPSKTIVGGDPQGWFPKFRGNSRRVTAIVNASKRRVALALPVTSLNDYQGLVKIDLT